MAIIPQNEYNPTYVFPPGDTLKEELEVRGITAPELASQMGYPLSTVTGIIAGKVEITPEIATQLERVLDVSAAFWNNIERYYRDWLARQADSVAIAA